MNEEKLILAKRVTYLLLHDTTAEEQKVAEDIARVLLSDVEVRVRQALVREIGDSAKIPESLAKAIAMDVEAVASPFLEVTKALSDEAMIELIPVIEEFARAAIARRPAVSSAVGTTIAEFSSRDTIEILLKNAGARVSESLCQTIMHNQPAGDHTLNLLACRPDLPSTMVDQLAAKVSAKYVEVLVSRYGLNSEHGRNVGFAAATAASGRYFESKDPEKVKAYVLKLHKSASLVPETILANLRHGNVIFFYEAMALLTQLSSRTIKLALARSGDEALRKILKRAQISPAYYERFERAYKISLDEF